MFLQLFGVHEVVIVSSEGGRRKRAAVLPQAQPQRGTEAEGGVSQAILAAVTGARAVQAVAEAGERGAGGSGAEGQQQQQEQQQQQQQQRAVGGASYDVLSLPRSCFDDTQVGSELPPSGTFQRPCLTTLNPDLCGPGMYPATVDATAARLPSPACPRAASCCPCSPPPTACRPWWRRPRGAHRSTWPWVG